MSEATCELPQNELQSVPGMGLIAETLDRLRNERGELEQFIESAFSTMEELGSKLSARQNQIAAREAQLNEREQQLASRGSEHADLKQLVQQQAAQLETLTGELKTVRNEMSTAVQGQGGGSMQAVVSKLEEQRDDLKQRLDVCREELARRADATEQLAAAQAQISDSRQTILQLHERIEKLTKEAGAAGVDHERVALETELEMVRRRAAELSESLAEQKDQLTHQQALWSAELNNLRQIIDSQSGAWANQAAAASPTAEAPSAAAAPATAAASAPAEPVVDSIMEQFAKLQKDVAQRRKRKMQ